MPRPIDRMTANNLNAVLEYLSDEVENAETKEDLNAVLEIARNLLTPNGLRNTVQGLAHIRAEVDATAILDKTAPNAAAQDTYACTLQLEVPQILSNTFQDLSDRMNQLQNEDPETFANATSALSWLATGKLQSH